jgi:hypothetical protein
VTEAFADLSLDTTALSRQRDRFARDRKTQPRCGISSNNDYSGKGAFVQTFALLKRSGEIASAAQASAPGKARRRQNKT